MKKLFTRELKLAYLTVFEILLVVGLVAIPIGYIKYEWIQFILCIIIPFVGMPFVLKLIDYNDAKYFKN